MDGMGLIDQLLSDFRPDGDVCLQRGQDFRALSEKADTGLLDDLVPGGEHNRANPGGVSMSVTAAPEDWHQSGAAVASSEDSLMGDVLKSANGEEQTGGAPMMTTAAVKMRISALLHLGYTPNKVAAYLNKLAEAVMFDRSEGAAFLQDKGGLEGFSVIEPNHFNKSCQASLKHIKAKGQLRAASVKRIAACENCSECKCSPNSVTKDKCATYGLPIVANAEELNAVIARIVPAKTAKKVALMAKHNGVQEEARPGHTVVAVAQTYDRDTKPKVAGQGSTLTAFDAQAHRDAAQTFGARAVKASIDGGKTFADTYLHAKNAHGSAAAHKACSTYLDSLKKTGARINLAAVDCSLLKKRLTASETIIGKDKCASCTMRGGMHCGFTGGTLLSYPGMEAQNAKTAAARRPGADGVSVMAAMELREPELVVPMATDRKLGDVEMSSTPLTLW
jgi:hypothetical protein